MTEIRLFKEEDSSLIFLETSHKSEHDGEGNPLEAGDDTSRDLITPLRRINKCQYTEPDVELVYMPARSALTFADLQSDEKP
jgi:hypothetical protein